MFVNIKSQAHFCLFKKKKYIFKFDNNEQEIIRNVGLADIKFKLSELGMLEYSISLDGLQERKYVLDNNDTEYYIPIIPNLCCLYQLGFATKRRII